MKIEKPIFIIGTGRCGSTIFYEIFSYHPNISWSSGALDIFPKKIRVLKTASDDGQTHLNTKIKSLKKYVKKVKKDLRISFSKYNFTLESQIKKLEYLENYFKAMESASTK